MADDEDAKYSPSKLMEFLHGIDGDDSFEIK